MKLPPSHPKVRLPTPKAEDVSGGPEEELLREQLLDVTPGSPEAEELMETLEGTVKRLAPKNKTTASVLGILAKALWKDRQGMYLECKLHIHM